MLPVLTLSGPQSLLYLNGHFAGLSQHAALPLSANAVHTLQLFPLGASQCISLCLTVKNGFLASLEPEIACAVQWPDGRIALEISETIVSAPRLLSSYDLDGKTYLLVEENGSIFLGTCSEDSIRLPVTDLKEPVFSSSPEGLMLSGHCSCGEFQSLFSLYPDLHCLYCIEGESISSTPDGRIHCLRSFPTFRRHVSRLLLQPASSGAPYLKKEQILPAPDAPSPSEPREIIRCFLESLELHCPEEAAGYLLAPDTLDPLMQRIGEFDFSLALPSAVPLQFGIFTRLSPSAARVRALTFEMDEKGEKIMNITVFP